MSRIGQYLSHLKAYDGQILCMDTPWTKLIDRYFCCYEKQVTMTTERNFEILKFCVWTLHEPNLSTEIIEILKLCVWTLHEPNLLLFSLLWETGYHGNRETFLYLSYLKV